MRARRSTFLRIAFAVAILAALACSPEQAEPDPRDAKADQVVEHLTAGRFDAVVSMLHFPASQTPDERAADMKSTEWTLGAVLDQFGSIESAKPAVDAPASLSISIAAGDDKYWKAYPRTGVGRQISYDVQFSKLGDGLLTVSFFAPSEGRELRAVGPDRAG